MIVYLLYFVSLFLSIFTLPYLFAFLPHLPVGNISSKFIGHLEMHCIVVINM